MTNKKDGFTTGYDKDVLELINKITDTNFQLVTGTWKEMLEKAINKEIDGLSTSVVYKEREKYFYFSDTYTNTQKYLITLDINPKDIYNIDDFAAKRIAYHQDNIFRKDYPSKILKNSIRNTDTLARWGGEEFIIICSNTKLDEAEVLAKDIRKTLENTNFDKVGRKTISLGVTQFYENDDVITIFKRADDALYEAKTTGKNRVCAI